MYKVEFPTDCFVTGTPNNQGIRQPNNQGGMNQNRGPNQGNAGKNGNKGNNFSPNPMQ